MAVPIVGKYIVLPVLLLLFYVSYGFRIRDVGQAGSLEQHSACTLDPSKCQDVDTTNDQVTTISSRRNRVDADGVGGIGRIKLGTGSVQKIEGDVKVSKWENVKELKYGFGKVKLKGMKETIVGDDGDDEDDDDDDDEDVIIEDENELDELSDEDTEEENDSDDDDDDEGEDDVREMESSMRQDPKWSVRSGVKRMNRRELDEEVKESDDDNELDSILKRVDGRKVSNRGKVREERMRGEKIQAKKRVEVDDEEDEANESKDDDESGDDSDHEDVVKVEKSVLPQRKLEKVRLANKDKIKPMEVPVVETVKEQSGKVERKEKAGKDVDAMLKIDSPASPSPGVIEDKEKKTLPQGTKKKGIAEATKLVEDRAGEATAKTTKKVSKKKTDVISQEVKGNAEKQSKVKPKNKSTDSDKKNDAEGKKKLLKKQSETSISLNKLNDEILRLPNFVPNFTAVENTVCQQHGKIFLRQFRGHKLWAFQMLDSSAKIPSGLLRGNVNQLGDYDQCLGISARVKVDERAVKVQGKYCLANIDVYATIPDMKVPASLMQSRNFLRGTMRDTGHFVPKFTTINWALCLPAACSATDAQIAVSSALSYLNNTSGLKFIVDVDPDMCYVRQRMPNYSKETIGVLYFYAMICCLVFVATLRDFLVSTEVKANYSERIIMSFSLRRTMKILMKPVRVDSDDINCIHGIRSLATIALYIAHKIIPLAGLPYSNRIVLTEVSNNPLSCLLRVSIVYTDSFLILSGVLSAFNMSRDSESRGGTRWFCRFVGRFIRLTPALLVIIFWYAYVMEHTGSGPQWNIMKENADLCKQNSWTNLLYIQNFFPFEEMCATHTHQLALDMQLSLLAPILVYFLQAKPIIGILMMFFLLQVSATIRYFVTTNNYLSVVIFHGMTAKHLYKTANLTYAVSIHRITPYLFGIGLGVLMHYTGKNFKMYRIFAVFGWILALLLGAWSIFSPWAMAKRDYVYDPEGNAHYAVLGPVSWALSLCWIIFACFTDHAGIINRFLSNYWLVVFSRISYSVYLTQFAVFFYNLATTRYSSEFQVHRAIDFYEVFTVIAISTVLTLFFDIPMQEVKSVLMDCTDVSATKADKSNDSSEDPEKESKISINNENPEDENLERSDTKPNDKQEMSIASNFYDEKLDRQSLKWTRETEREYDSGVRERRRSKSVQKSYFDHDVGLRRDTTPSRQQNDTQRARRSSSKPAEGNYKQPNNRDDIHVSKRDRSGERRRERLGKLSRKTPVRIVSSGSEDELLQRRGASPRRPVERPRVSDEEDWEQELRIRRRRFMERMASEVQDSKSEKENSQDAIMRRSSAEGKIALLTGATGCRGMDAWTVSRGPGISIVGGSSQEPSENEDESCITGEYEQSEEESKVTTPLRLDVAEEEDKYELVLDSANNSRPMIDLRRPSQEEIPADKARRLSGNEVTPVATGKLFKRESIVKSQASEEDPEYLLPERPKLVEQEQEHPFKKAWQMQKSRSEEDGPSAFTIREVKSQHNDSNQQEKMSSSPSISRPTPQTFQLVVEDVDLGSQQADNDNARSDADAKQSGRGASESAADHGESSKIDLSNDEGEVHARKGDQRHKESSDQDSDVS